MPSRADSQVQAALSAIEAEEPSIADKVEMLMEMAIGLQTRPKSPDQLHQAVALYRKALELCPAEPIFCAGGFMRALPPRCRRSPATISISSKTRASISKTRARS